MEFRESAKVLPSMSKAGCPYGNAPMERCFNTLKNECANLYEFRTEEMLYRTVEEFADVTYNLVSGFICLIPHPAMGLLQQKTGKANVDSFLQSGKRVLCFFRKVFKNV